MKWFWISFFAFLAVLVGSAALARPDTVSNTLTFVGTFLTVASWTILALIVAGALFFAWLKWRRDALKSLRTQDGHFPIQRIKLQNGGVAFFDPNLMVGAVAIINRADGALTEPEPAAGWHIQATIRAFVERTRTAQAIYQGDDSRSSKYGALSRPNSAAGAAKLLADPKPVPQLPATVDVPPVPVPATVREWTPQDALNLNTRTKLAIGADERGELVKWNMVESPHLRVHGQTQGSGKTTLIQTLAAGAVRTGAHLIVLDSRRFKDWSAFAGCAELIDTRDPERFADAITKLAAIYQERDGQLGAAGAPNIASLDKPPQRIVAVIAEFGSLCERAKETGALARVLHPLQLILREAGAAGVHILIEDQIVSKKWPIGISANAEPVTGYLPQNYGAAGGWHNAHTLPPHAFHYGAQTVKTWNVAAQLPALLAGYPAGGKLVSGEGKPVHSQFTEPVQEPVHSQFIDRSPEVDPPPTNAVNCAPTSVDGWYEWTLETYLPTHAQLLQVDAQGRGVGVKALGEAMAAHNGKEYDAMKGTASEVAKRIRNDVIAGGFGTDISVSA